MKMITDGSNTGHNNNKNNNNDDDDKNNNHNNVKKSKNNNHNNNNKNLHGKVSPVQSVQKIKQSFKLLLFYLSTII